MMGTWGDRPAIWPPRPTEEEMTVPRLSKDGMHVEGWVRPPADGVWKPSDLLWLPPSATKSTDIDGIGQIVDVKDYGIGDYGWVTAQLARREKYLDYIRDRVRAGTYRLTAALAKMLGLDFADGAELVPLSRPFVYSTRTATAKALVDEGRRLAGAPADADVRSIAAVAARRFADTGDMAAAVEGILESIRQTSLRIDPDTGLPVVPGQA